MTVLVIEKEAKIKSTALVWLRITDTTYIGNEICFTVSYVKDDY